MTSTNSSMKLLSKIELNEVILGITLSKITFIKGYLPNPHVWLLVLPDGVPHELHDVEAGRESGYAVREVVV